MQYPTLISPNAFSASGTETCNRMVADNVQPTHLGPSPRRHSSKRQAPIAGEALTYTLVIRPTSPIASVGRSTAVVPLGHISSIHPSMRYSFHPSWLLIFFSGCCPPSVLCQLSPRQLIACPSQVVLSCAFFMWSGVYSRAFPALTAAHDLQETTEKDLVMNVLSSQEVFALLLYFGK